MKTIVSLSGVQKDVGANSKILYPVYKFKVGEELEIVDKDGNLVNLAVVTLVGDDVEIEITA